MIGHRDALAKKSMRITCSVFLVVLIAHLTGSGQQSATHKSDRVLLLGTWVLVSRQDRTAGGQLRAETNLGDAPVGLLIYDATGHVAAQLMNRARTVTPGSMVTVMGGKANNSGSIAGYDAYFGTYSVNTESRTVTHHLDGALVPTDVGKSVTRKYEISTDTLKLSLETTAADGTAVTRTLVWVRGS
jgi:hypothetical protein